MGAALGVQLVVTLFTATLMHRLAPHCSFARWLLCNGSLFRYIHPSEEELRMLAGKPRHRGRKDRWANSLHDEKPLSVPRDAPFHLETCPLTAADALVLRFFLEYQWFVDFAVYSVGVFLFTEVYYFVLGPVQETNIAVFCKVFLMVTRLYFSAKDGGERAVCLTSALLFLLLAMLVQVVREELLELGLEPGLASMAQNLEPVLKKQDWDWALPVTKLAIRLGLAMLGSLLGAFLIFPGLRLAQTHQDALTLSADRPLLQLGGAPGVRPSEGAFDSLRLWVLVVLCLLRLVVTRSHLQAYLCLAKTRVEQLRKEAGRIEAREIQQRVCTPSGTVPGLKGPGRGVPAQGRSTPLQPLLPPHQVVRVYCYVTVVSLQYLTPLILTLHCTLLLKTLGAGLVGKEAGARSGGYSWALGPVPTPLTPRQSSDILISVDPAEDEAQQTAAQVAGVLGSLLTPLLLRGVLAYLIWWTAACQLLSSLFGLYFHQRLAVS
ncbi:hypothetical protein U0070_004312 [Myodes glareolus]|uniref:Transmembrane protein 161A n=1 Tax=Myodes glareolus TaxID=447135 RepID=A0AAW0HSR9_MYOGA